MKTIFLVIAFSALAAAVPEWKDWHVTYGYDGPTNTSFYPIPLNEAEAKSQNWVAVDTAGPLKVTCYCLPDDPRYCMLYDSKGKVAGFQVGVLDSDVAGIAPSYVMSNIAMYTLQTMFGIKVWTAQCYVIDPAIIQAGGSSNTDGTFGSGGVWLKNGDNYIQVSKNETIMAATTSYTREICVNKMGKKSMYLLYNGDTIRIMRVLGMKSNIE